MSTRPTSFSQIEQMVVSEALEAWERVLRERELNEYYELSEKEERAARRQLNALRRVQKRLRP